MHPHLTQLWTAPLVHGNQSRSLVISVALATGLWLLSANGSACLRVVNGSCDASKGDVNIGKEEHYQSMLCYTKPM